MGSEPHPIEQVRTGMHGIDADGTEIGTVKDVVMGDPEADTVAEAPEPSGTAFAGPGGAVPVAASVGTLGGILGDDLGKDLPEVERSRLLRSGYVRINLKGLFSGHRFAAADDIADVSDDVVHLAVDEGHLVH
jgi:hypothetical protein